MTERGVTCVKRIEVLDVWRSLAILLMVVYHFMYDLYMFGVIGPDVLYSGWAYAIRHCAAGSFMIISGAVVRFSRNSVRRGAVVFCCGMLVTVVMGFMGMAVQFGVLHHLGTMMIAYGIISRRVKVPKGLWFPIVCMAVFALTYYIYDTVIVETHLLIPIGLRYSGFSSADYYPLLPWGMLFAIGVWLGGLLAVWRERAPLLQRQYHPALTIAGRNSLIIYLAHQPILYGLCWLLWGRG